MVTIAMEKCVAKYLLVEIEDEIAEKQSSIFNSRTTNECSWSKWSECSESCGNGFIERARINTAGKSGKENCIGLPKETKRCQERTNNCEVLPWCVEIITGDNELHIYNDGKLKVDIFYQFDLNDTSKLEQYKKPLTMYQLREQVVKKCFTRLDSIILQNTDLNAWTGKIIVTKDGVKKDLICIDGCTNKRKLSNDWIDVDGNGSKPNSPLVPWCYNGNACKIVPEKRG